MMAKRIISAVTLVMIAVGAGVSAGGANTVALRVNDITGSWIVTATPTEGLPPVPFKVLENYSRDGGFVGSAQGDNVCCPTSSPGYGAWERTGPRTFAVTFLAMWYDQERRFLGTLKIRQAVTLSESSDHYHGVAEFSFSDPGGNVSFSGSATTEAVRIAVERLE